MGLFDFFWKKNNGDETKGVDSSTWIGKDFEFLLKCDLDPGISQADYDKLMTPESFVSNKINRDNWVYYEVGGDEFSYSWEEPGIQMTFNPEISYKKAKKIADEIVEKIKSVGTPVELVVLVSGKIYKF